MKPSREGPFPVKPTREELQARVDALAKKKISVKRKAQAPPESNLAIQGKIPRLGASSPPSTTKDRGSSDQVLARGQAAPSMAEVSKVAGPKNPLGRTAKPPLEVLPIYVWSHLVQKAKLPPTTSEDGEGIALKLRGMRTRCLLTRSSPPGLCRPSYKTLTSRGRMPCPLRRLYPYRFMERPPYVQTPLFVNSTVVSNYPLILSRFCR